MVDPITCVPSPALIMPQATPAAEPLDEPPGVCSRFQGLRVPRGSDAANSVGAFLPTMMAPAERSAETQAASLYERQPANSGEPICVGMSAVSMISFTPIGMPSIAESGVPERQRAVDRSAAARAASRLKVTKAPTLGSRASSSERQDSRKALGVSAPFAKRAVCDTKGRTRGLVDGSGALIGFSAGLALRQFERGSTALALDHGGAQQEPARALRIGRNGPQLVEIAFAQVRVARFQPVLVGNRLLLDELDGNCTALQIINIE